jgi:hypothetical protein
MEARVDAAEDFVLRSTRARHQTAERSALLSSHLEWVHEAALLKVGVAFEHYLETSMGLYVLGERTNTGFRPRRKKKVSMNLPSILDVFRGDQDFVGWNTPEHIIRRAEKWLRNGEPFFTSISAASQTINFLRYIRNVIAHDSDSANEKLEKATRRLYGALPKARSPGALLIAVPPPGLPVAGQPSLFAAAMSTYKALAVSIVP